MQLIQLFIFILYSILSPDFAYAETGSVSPYIIYISTQGSDFANGQSPSLDNEGINGPFATLKRARHALRQQRKYVGLPNGATIYVREGIYELPETFLLEAQDSGSAHAPITFQTYNNEKVILSGGRQLSSCSTNKLELITCNTSSLNLQTLGPLGIDKRLQAAPLPSFEVFINSQRLQLSRWPNSDKNAPGGDTWAYISSASKGARTEFEYRGNKTDFSTLSENAVIHIWPGNDWFDEYIGVSKKTDSSFILAEPSTYPIQSGRRFSILNESETMDAPGEWSYSVDEQKLSIIPIPKLNNHHPTVSYLNNIIEMREAKNIKFKGFIIEHSRKTAVKISGGNNNSLENCIVRNTGGYGIIVNKGKNHTVIQSEIHDTGYGGIILNGGNRKTLTPSSHIAINNNIHHTSRLVRVGTAALRLDGVGNISRHNQVHHTPGTAISIIGNNHLLELSDVHHACEQSSDCGAIYTGRDWTFHGNKIQYNRIHDIYGYGMNRVDTLTGIVEYETPHGARGVYLDDAASGFEVTGNIFYRIPDKMIQIGGGRHNTIDNNIFITNGYAIWIDARWPNFPWQKIMEPRLHAVPFKTTVWKKHFPRLAEPMQNPQWPEGNQITHNIILGEKQVKNTIVPFRYIVPKNAITIDNNIIYNHGKAVKVEYRFLDSDENGVTDWNIWKKTGLDKNSLLASPNFVDLSKGDIAFQTTSPALKLNIKELPVKNINLPISKKGNNFNLASPASRTYHFKLNTATTN